MTQDTAHIFSQVRRYSRIHRLRKDDIDHIVGGVVLSCMDRGMSLVDPMIGAITCNHIKRFVSNGRKKPKSLALRPRRLCGLDSATLAAPTLPDATETAEALLGMKEAILTLQPYLRKTINHHLEGKSSQEIAKIMGCKPHTVAVNRCRAMKDLKTEMVRMGF